MIKINYPPTFAYTTKVSATLWTFVFKGIMYLAVFLNFLTLFIIACEKLLSIRYPLMSRIWITMKRVRCLCSILWITGILSLIMVLLRWTHFGDDYNCWPDMIHEDIVWKYVIMTVFFLLSTLTYILYAYIGYMLYKRSHKGSLTPNPKPKHRNDLIFMNDVNGVISNLGVVKDNGEDDIVMHIKTKIEKDAKDIMSSDEINVEEIGRHNEKNDSANVDDLKDICNSKETPQEAKSIQKMSSINSECENGFDRKISSTGIFTSRSGSRSSGNSIDGVSNRHQSSRMHRKRNSFQIILESKTVRMLFISMFVYYFLYLPNVITILLDADDIFRHLATVVFFCNYFINPVIYWFYPNFNEAYMSLLRNGRETRT